VTKLYQLEDEYYGVHLNDGIDEIWALIDVDQYNELSSINNKNLEFKIQANSIIIINEIRFFKKSYFSEKLSNQFQNDDFASVLIIMKASIIGEDKTEAINVIDSTITKVKEDLQKHKEHDQEDIKQQDQASTSKAIATSIPFVKVAELDIGKHKKGNFQIKLWLCDKSEVTPFNSKSNNRQNNRNDYRIRLKFCDETSYLEAVAFGKNALSCKNLELKKWYLLNNAYISESRFRQWPRQSNSSTFDITINNETLIEEIHNETTPPMKISNKESKQKNSTSNSSKRMPNSSSNLNMNELTSNAKRSCNDNKYQSPPLVLKCADNFEFSFTPLNTLPLVEPKTTVNVYGIVIKVDHMNKYIRSGDMSECELKHVYIKDNSNVQVRCAFWGKQAAEFKFQPGTILLLRDVEVTRYDGITLNILRASGIIQITSDHNFSFYNDLLKMYLNDN
jgi:hypothetical protein